ncbi:MAG: hypothetical protein FJ104_15305, partial [Deltaproteobacteria bacterium]|nr:hypothetical protein [Deltaproteobacteria bacterium]
MKAPRPEEQLQSAYLGPLAGARGQSALGAFVLLALVGALVARGGTLPLRLGAL